MSKHSSAEDKLHISPNLRSAAKKIPTQKINPHNLNQPPGPIPGTNSKNQFR